MHKWKEWLMLKENDDMQSVVSSLIDQVRNSHISTIDNGKNSIEQWTTIDGLLRQLRQLRNPTVSDLESLWSNIKHVTNRQMMSAGRDYLSGKIRIDPKSFNAAVEPHILKFMQLAKHLYDELGGELPMADEI